MIKPLYYSLTWEDFYLTLMKNLGYIKREVSIFDTAGWCNW